MKDRIIRILRTEKDPTIRFEVLEKFHHYASNSDDIQILLNILRNDADICVRHEAAAQLFRLEETNSELLDDSRREVVEALFDRVFRDKSTVVRHESIEALGYLASEGDLARLEKLTWSDEPDIRSTASIAFHAASKRVFEEIPAKDLSIHLIQSWAG